MQKIHEELLRGHAHVHSSPRTPAPGGLSTDLTVALSACPPLLPCHAPPPLPGFRHLARCQVLSSRPVPRPHRPPDPSSVVNGAGLSRLTSAITLFTPSLHGSSSRRTCILSDHPALSPLSEGWGWISFNIQAPHVSVS